jgi:glyoxylase-like metal-dependent hydrolase (beta-lactamase superfamily II)
MIKYQLGSIELNVLDAGPYHMDGGVLFGVVPRKLWADVMPSDKNNRVKMSTHPLLIRTSKHIILVDSGYGNKLSEKVRRNYGVTGDSVLLDELAAAGVEPEDVDTVILTHLHFDHAGGLTMLDEDDLLQITFPNAVHLVQRAEWDEATRPNERTRAGYRPDDFLPIKAAGQFKLLEGNYRVTTGVQIRVTGGHTTAHQIVRITSKKQRAYFAGDILPVTAHVRLPWIAAVDLLPLTTLEEKRYLLRHTSKRGDLVFFYHDAECPAARIVSQGKDKFDYVPVSPSQ